jgi:hypothetical protein
LLQVEIEEWFFLVETGQRGRTEEKIPEKQRQLIDVVGGQRAVVDARDRSETVHPLLAALEKIRSGRFV